MTVAVGQIAPTFEAQTHHGDTVSLEALRGQKVWLGFYRWAACPLCNLRVSEMLKSYDAVQRAGIVKLAVFQSPSESIDTGVGKQKPPFPIIPDPNLELYARYGVGPRLAGMFYPRVMVAAVRATLRGFLSLKIEGPKAMVPADFLIDPEGVIHTAYYGRAVSDHIPLEQVYAFGEDLCLDMPAAPAA